MVDTKKVNSDGDRFLVRRRRAHGAAFKRRIVKLTLEAGASVARIALEHGLNANLVFKWRREHLRALAKARSPATTTTLLPVQVETARSATELTPIVADIARSSRSAAGGSIELDLPGGRLCIRGSVDADALRLAVQLLSTR